MAFAGLHPVVAVYATFLNRAVDQVIMDVALHKAGVTFCLTTAVSQETTGRATTACGTSRCSASSPASGSPLPVTAPRCAPNCARPSTVDDAPTVVRFPKGSLPPDLPAVDRIGALDVLERRGEEDVLVVAVGAMAALAVEVAQRLSAQGIGVTVVDPRWVLPVDEALVPLAARHRLVAVVEDNARAGGIATAVQQRLSDAGVLTPVRGFGIPQEFLDHARRPEVLERIGLTAQDVSRHVVEAVARIDARLEGVDLNG